ncbi:peptidoglycan-binding protein [Phycicoccus sp. M110.8]|uniref:peptidoglycan-binding protein n=1 Tax=Phycicoccus sp. M110.8 TaxID=3075433 RepID=UPI0028FDAA10|nr:peptidoglycan-binding protein [Phycicoccus sp. M110.8]MDU0314891.1 peptidoglycan-binding protein [Phycicoccus sp. M110.8]
MTDSTQPPLTAEELAAEGGTALPDKEVISLLDLNADLDLGLDAAAPIDLAVAANANVAAPIEAAVGANVLSVGSDATALASQGAHIDQGITGEAVAHGEQGSTIDQTDAAPAPADGTDTTVPTDGSTTDGTAPTDGTLPTDGTVPTSTDAAGPLDGPLLNVDVNLATDLKLAAPITGAVAANANVAAPIDASVAGNIGSVDSHAASLAQQDVAITQHVDADANATTDQSSDISQ